MKITDIIIKNFRNLNNTKIELHPTTNFIVGENDLGKSNFLDLLDLLLNKGRFPEEDFSDENKDIEILFSLILDQAEYGVFEDNFNPQNCDKITIKATQGLHDFVRYHHVDTGQEIFRKQLRCLNYIRYDPLRKPVDELSFFKRKGAGKLLHYLVDQFLSNNTEYGEDIVNEEFSKKIVEYINERLKKISVLNEFEIETAFENDNIDLIRRMLVIEDSNGFDIKQIGHGVQFSVLIIFSILGKLMEIIDGKTHQDCIFHKDNKNSISLILGLDEPEIHLHPYRQRNLMNYINKILSNRETNFSSLLKDLFNIDNINGQSIIVTHSPNIISENYKQINRFYKEDGLIKIKSGNNITLDYQLEKHLRINFPYIKEAFFSRCNIIVEGHSEYGAFPIFAKRTGTDLDKLGISITKAASKDSVVPLMNLLNSFNISNVGIMDGDGFARYRSNPNLYSTNGADFEEDIYDAFNVEDFVQYVEKNEVRPIKREIMSLIETEANKLGVSIYKNEFVSQQLKYGTIKFREELKEKIKNKSIEKLGRKKNKTVITGNILANDVTKVPDAYQKLIKEAVRLSL